MHDAREAIREFDGANAYGQPIRLTLMQSREPVTARSRSLFERIDGGGRDAASRGRPHPRRRSASPAAMEIDGEGSRRRRRTPENIDRYVPGRARSRSPRRGRGGRGRGRGRADGDGHRIVGGRPRKTAEELDAEMTDYWGGDGTEEKAAPAPPAAPIAAVTGPTDDVEMIE